MVLMFSGRRSMPVFGPVALCVAMYVYLSTSINISTASVGYQELQNMNMAVEMAVVEISAPTATYNTPLLQINSTSLKPSSPPIDVCFVSSIFAPTVHTADRPNDFLKFELTNTSSFQFFIYTNLEDLESPGWTKVLRNFTNYRRFITQSRWGKFMAWKDPEMQACQTIFYFDGHFKPSAKGERLVHLAETIKQSEFGLAQNLSPKRRTALAEFAKILKARKDIEKNVNASIAWLHSQPDFHNNCTLYRNANFGKAAMQLRRVCVCVCLSCFFHASAALPTHTIHLLTIVTFICRLRSHQYTFSKGGRVLLGALFQGRRFVA
jgi:hypothetical protein